MYIYIDIHIDTYIYIYIEVYYTINYRLLFLSYMYIYIIHKYVIFLYHPLFWPFSVFFVEAGADHFPGAQL